MNQSKGFTLIEIAIVLTIIGILLGVILLRSGAVIGNAKTTDTIALVKDLNAAIYDFKNRFHYMPGDLPNAKDDIPGIAAGSACDISPNGTIGNGQVDTDPERACVAVELVQAGLIKGNTSGIYTRSGAGTPDVLVTARRTAGLLPATVINEIELKNQPCEIAKGIDLKMDDGNFSTGNIRAGDAAGFDCTPGGVNDPVPFVDIAL